MKLLLNSGKLFTAACLLGAALSLFGCGDRAEELYDTAQFEELQNNKAHARKLYERIIRDHGDSPYAARAKQRLAELAESSQN